MVMKWYGSKGRIADLARTGRIYWNHILEVGRRARNWSTSGKIAEAESLGGDLN